MVSDVNEWLKERRTIHDAGTPKAQGRWSYRVDQGDFDAPIMDGKGDYLGCSPDDGVRAGFDTEVAEHIADAHNTLPNLLTAVENVLELHTETVHGECAICFECTYDGAYEADYSPLDYPCPTVRAIEGAIDEH